MKRTDAMMWCAALSLIAGVTACGGGGGTGTGGSGGTGTSSTTTSTGSTTSSTTSTTSTSSTGTGGGAACLDPSLYASQFTIADPSFCATALYTASESIGFTAPSWGSHDGPLTLRADMTGGGVTLVRWTPPSGAMGDLTKKETHVAAGVPTGAFLGAAANDMPFFGWTAISYTDATMAGSLLMIKGSSVDATYAVKGIYAVAGLPAASNLGRVLFTALSPLGSSAPDSNALYAADACDMPKPDLGAGTGCTPSAAVAAWGENSGPIAIDHDGNAFSVLTKATAMTQEARGFAAAKVARGAGPSAGVTLFTIPGFGGSMAAITPANGAPGILVFQPFDATTFAPLDVIEQPYTVSGDVAPMGASAKLLTVPAMSMNGLSFMTDSSDRLWVASAGTSTTTYVVIEKKP